MIRAKSLDELVEQGITRAALAFGVFDGLHRGHQKIMAELHRVAAAKRAGPVVVTFDPHPQKVLQPTRAPRQLLSLEHKLSLLEHTGLAATVVLPFTRELAQLPPETFINETVLAASSAEIAAICIGEH